MIADPKIATNFLFDLNKKTINNVSFKSNEAILFVQ